MADIEKMFYQVKVKQRTQTKISFVFYGRLMESYRSQKSIV